MALGARIVRDEVTKHLRDDPTLAGPLLRLAFHDAATREADEDDGDTDGLFTGGPNGSIQYELEWSENRGLGRPLQVVQQMYEMVEGYISLADTIALAGAAAVENAGGPKISVKLGHVDAAEADPRKRRRTLQMDTIDHWWIRHCHRLLSTQTDCGCTLVHSDSRRRSSWHCVEHMTWDGTSLCWICPNRA